MGKYVKYRLSREEALKLKPALRQLKVEAQPIIEESVSIYLQLQPRLEELAREWNALCRKLGFESYYYPQTGLPQFECNFISDGAEKVNIWALLDIWGEVPSDEVAWGGWMQQYWVEENSETR